MMTQGPFRTLISFMFIMFVFTVLTTGCGGGGSDLPNSNTPPAIDTPPPSSESPPAPSQTGSLVAGPIPISAVFTGSPVTLDGSNSSSAEGSTVSFAWKFTSRPKGSAAQLQNANTAKPSFTTDVTGTYLVEMVITDNNGNTARDVATVIASDQNPSGLPYTGKWKHQGLRSYCVNCHDGNQVGGDGTVTKPKSGDHLATNNSCEDCHTPLGFEIYVHFDHNEIFGACSDCHDGVTAIGKSQFHETTSKECNSSGCHDTDKFVKLPLLANGSYDHTQVSTFCSACHRGIVATGKTANHIQTEQECGFCHSSSFGYFGQSPDGTYSNGFPDHTNIQQPCTDCHDGNHSKITGPTPAHEKIMLISGVDCKLCHDITGVTNPANLSFKMTSMNHAVVEPSVVRCDTCHYDNNKFTLPVRSTGSAPNPPGHRVLSGEDCYLCHDTTDFANFFDHTAVVGQPCGQSGCHDGSDPAIVSVPTDGTHIPLTLYNEDCGVCHTSPGGTFAAANFDHTTHAVDGQCATCHNGNIAIGQNAYHILTNPPGTEECSNCHSATKFDNFKGAIVDHTNRTSNCGQSGCHDGLTAITKPSTHVPTPSGVDCSVCHVTGGTAVPSPFAPANNFAHQASTLTDGCNGCHNGSYYLKPVPPSTIPTQVMPQPATTHIPTVDDCGTCHTDTTIPGGFKSSNFFTVTHTTYKNGCKSCHTGSYPPALSKDDAPTPPGHVPTSQDCSYCHVNTDFKDTSNFTHENITSNCVSCHNGNFTSVNALGTQNAPNGHPDISDPNGGPDLDCYNCHRTDAGTFAVQIVNHSTLTTNCDRAGCHDGASTASNGNPIRGQNFIPNHISTTGRGCEDCHTAGGSFGIASFDHGTLSATTRCDSCHDGNSAGVYGTNYISNHWVIDPTKQDCGDCHSTESFTNGNYNHNGIDSNCVSCHNGTNAPGKTTTHIPTGEDCSVCHTTASVNFKPATFAHSAKQIGSTACHICHSGDYPAAQGQGPNHQATGTTECDVCHDTVDWYNAGHDHSTTPNNCARSNCHDGKTQGIRGMSSIQTHLPTGLDCVACHTAGGSFVTNKWDHSENINTLNCGECHDTNVTTNHTPYNIAKPKPSNTVHFNTTIASQNNITLDCHSCHNTIAFKPADTYQHDTANDFYPGDHYTDPNRPANNVIQSCYACHINKNDTDFAYLTDSRVTNYYPPKKAKVTCAACHFDNYRSGVDEHNGISNDYQCDDCHHHSIKDTRW